MKSLYAIAAGAALALLPASVKVNDFETEVLDATENAELHGMPLSMNELQPNGNEVTKYAFVVVASGRGERGADLSDPIDKNFFWLGGVRVYDSLREMGFQPENIRFLYSTGDPDFTDTLEARAIQMVKEEQFNGTYDNKATEANINLHLRRFAGLVDSNDIFAMYIGTHGAPSFLELEADGYFSAWTAREVQESVDKINPGFGILYSDACHSGAFIAQLNLPEYVAISTTGSHTYGWGDRYFSGGSYFFQNMTDGEADANVDGKITVMEAYNRAQSEATAHMQRIDNYLHYTYNWGSFGGYESEVVTGKISVQQEMVVGSSASADFYIYDTNMTPIPQPTQ
ncbi:MAG: C13 family peptidase [Candidatus Nanoarchaeia archaeon]|nr:C13 family peptidase [Candidatus Nanoarchaeia archaeon]